MPRSDNTAFRIEILEGQRKGAVIDLVGRTAPYGAGSGGSISFGVQQRTKLIWNQGSPNATQLVFGPTLDPTTINGIWKDRYVGTDGALQLIETFTELCNSGVQVYITWAAIQRAGVVKSFNWKPGTPNGGLDNVAWDLSFEWNRTTKNGQLFIPKQFGAPKIQRDGVADTGTRLVQFRDSVSNFIEGVGSFAGTTRDAMKSTLVEFDSLVGTVESVIDALEDAAGKLGFGDGANTDALEQTGTALDRGIDTVWEVQEVTGGLDPLRMVDGDSVEGLVQNQLQVADTVDKAFAFIEIAYEAQIEAEQELAPFEVVTIPAPTGFDLRKISYQFYGTTDLWAELARYNGITEGSVIPPDMPELYVPLNISRALNDRAGC